MAKLSKHYWVDLNEDQQNRIKESFCESGFNIDYLSGKPPSSLVSALVVVDEDFVLYDIRIFDPYHLVKTGEHLPVYIKPGGWSNWLYDYRDTAGHDVDEILEAYDGVPQDFS